MTQPGDQLGTPPQGDPAAKGTEGPADPSGSQPLEGAPPAIGSGNEALGRILAKMPESVKALIKDDVSSMEKGFMRQDDYSRKTTEVSQQRDGFSRDKETLQTLQGLMKDPMVMSAIGVRFNKPDMVHQSYAFLAESKDGRIPGQTQTPATGGDDDPAFPESFTEGDKQAARIMMDKMRGEFQQDREQMKNEFQQWAEGRYGKQLGQMQLSTAEKELSEMEKRFPEIQVHRQDILRKVSGGANIQEAMFATIGPDLAKRLGDTENKLSTAESQHAQGLESQPPSRSGRGVWGADLKDVHGQGLSAYMDKLRDAGELPSQQAAGGVR